MITLYQKMDFEKLLRMWNDLENFEVSDIKAYVAKTYKKELEEHLVGTGLTIEILLEAVLEELQERDFAE
jgi:hypothetical protein